MIGKGGAVNNSATIGFGGGGGGHAGIGPGGSGAPGILIVEW
jgi:hypothetical protein